MNPGYYDYYDYYGVVLATSHGSWTTIIGIWYNTSVYIYFMKSPCLLHIKSSLPYYIWDHLTLNTFQRHSTIQPRAFPSQLYINYMTASQLYSFKPSQGPTSKIIHLVLGARVTQPSEPSLPINNPTWGWEINDTARKKRRKKSTTATEWVYLL